MKLTDALLHAWRDTLRRARNASAIFNADGKVLRTFGEIEECACEFEDDFEVFPPGRVIAIQIGNHEDWPPLLIACLRRQLVVLPLEESISAQQRDAALRLRHYSDLGSDAVAPKAYLWNNGRAACNSVWKPAIAGRLQPDLRYHGN